MSRDREYDNIIEESFPASDPPPGVIKLGPRQPTAPSDRASQLGNHPIPPEETRMPADTSLSRHDSERDRYILHLNHALAMESALVDHLEKRADSVANADIKRRLLQHRDETIQHRETVRDLIEGLHGEPTPTKATVQPPIVPSLMGKVMSALESEKEDRALREDLADFSVENYEDALYGGLMLIARNVGYPQHAARFEAIRNQERAMAEFIQDCQPRAVQEAFPPLEQAA